ncbi:hypothetical protein [Profundibacter amoris]|uniref:hypothetical protein n=1 Tax=Profundibacter amoris TaxID=2171755 RepID=UPI001E545CAF|nr:hypothetical protein [Profundibacter amoris]
MFERLLKGMPRLAALGQLFFGHQFFTLQLGNALFIGGNHGAVACINDTIKKLVDLLFQLFDVVFQALGSL